ncbi:glycosyltransferase family 4 protein [soil metagenome]
MVISYISSYTPRLCGIATFATDLSTSISKQNSSDMQVAALNNIKEGYKYSNDVKLEIKDKSISDFREAANFLNLSSTSVVNLQHEFGLYGGNAGSNILALIRNLKKPLVTTLHTILENPNPDQYKVFMEIADISVRLIVLSKRSVKMLQDIYNIPLEKIKYIPHGAHDVPFIDPAYYKDKFQLSDKKVLLTFGLLGPGKGLEDVINSLVEVKKEFPKFKYIILGATHPNVIKLYGEEYRTQLENLVRKNNLEENVLFINRFVNTAELLEFLLMSDIYISPYRNKEQVVSGTLTYALACGKAVISTPYWYAEELLAEERGILVPFASPDEISKALLLLLKDETLRNKYRKNAYDLGRKMIWPVVAKSYLDTFEEAIREHKSVEDFYVIQYGFDSFPSLPEVELEHLKALSDDTGIHQHAIYSVPNRNEGYCTDDNIRALQTLLVYKKITNDESVIPLIKTYFSFIVHAYNRELGLFKNFMSYDRKWLDERGSDDCNGRVLHVLGYIIKNPPDNSLERIAKDLFDASVEKISSFKELRTIASVIPGCLYYLGKFSGARDINRICKKLLKNLSDCYEKNSTEQWKWYEGFLTYENAKIPLAMLLGGRHFNDDKLIKTGLESLTWLLDIMTDKEHKHISLIGNEKWYFKGKERSVFDQQPVDIPCLIDACYQAYLCTNEKDWLNKASMAFSWFLGMNDRQQIMFDYQTGGCFDGLTYSDVNYNQGAESTISWLQSLLRMMRIREDLQINKIYTENDLHEKRELKIPNRRIEKNIREFDLS